MDNEEKVEEEVISKEELLSLIDLSTRYVRMKSLQKRIIVCALIIVSILYFIGAGNKSVSQYIFAFLALGAAYFLGRNDLTENQQVSALSQLRLQISMSQEFVFKMKQFNFPNGSSDKPID